MIYVVSDFHGNYYAWKNFRNALNPDDFCYVLGDACDRGTGGIDILTEIMEDKRFHYIIGNHDDFILRVFRPDLVHSQRWTSDWAERCWRHNTGPSIDEWLKLRRNNPNKFNELVNWLANCNVFLTTLVNSTVYRLAHAKYPKELDKYGIIKMSWKDMEACAPELLQAAIWDRYDKEDINNFMSENGISVIGHTPIPGKYPQIVNGFTNGLYNMDCGLGYGYNSVSVLCLSNGKLYTIDKENLRFPTGANKAKRMLEFELRDFRDFSGKKVHLGEVSLCCNKTSYYNMNDYYAVGYCTDSLRGWHHSLIDTSKILKIHFVDEELHLVFIETLNSVYYFKQ